MTIPEYVLGFLLIASAVALLSKRTPGVQDVERKLNLLLAHHGIYPTAQIAPSGNVMSLAADPQRRIEAIRAYRMETGAGLKDAVAAIDKIAAGAKGLGT